jgi:hypothetical protein
LGCIQHFENQVIVGGQPHDILAHLTALGHIGFRLQYAACLKQENTAGNKNEGA